MAQQGEVLLRVPLGDGQTVIARVEPSDWLATLGEREVSIAIPPSWTTVGHEASTLVLVEVEGHLLALRLPAAADAAALRRALSAGVLSATLLTAALGGIDAVHDPHAAASTFAGAPAAPPASATYEAPHRFADTSASMVIERPDITVRASPGPTPGASASAPAGNVARSAPAGPVSAPIIATGATPGYGRQTYSFEATMDFDAATLDVVEALEWTNLAPKSASWINLSVIPAEVGAFQLTGDVTVDNLPARAEFVGHRTNLQVRFPRAVQSGDSVRIVIPFRLEVGAYEGALGGRLTAKRGVVQFGEWFPVWSTAHGFEEVGDPQLTWTADSMVLHLISRSELGVDAVAATGTLRTGATGSDWTFEAHDVRDFAFTVSPSYEMVTTRVGTGDDATEIRAYATRASARSLLRDAVTAFTTFEDLFGEYGYETFSVAEVGSPYFSMEFPQLVFIGSTATGNCGVIAHELAHQWWYGLVGNDQMAEPWLDEAFAEFSAQLLGGNDAYASTEPVGQGVDDFTSWRGRNQYVQTIYGRGAAFLDALRDRVGDAAFFGSLREIVSTYRHKVVTTDEVLGVFRRLSDASIDDIVIEYGVAPG